MLRIMQMRLLDVLDEHNMMRDEKEQEKKRLRVHAFLDIVFYLEIMALSYLVFYMNSGSEKVARTTSHRARSFVWVQT